MYEGVVQDLIDELGRLPGVGPKSAQRIAFHILQADPTDVRRLAQVLQQQARADPSGFEDDRQAAARMRAAADQVNALKVFKAVVRAQVQHLVEAVREIEGRAAINFVARVPVRGRYHALITNATGVEVITGFPDLTEQ